MGFLVALAEWSVLAFGLLLLLSQVVAHEIGYLIGHRQSATIEGRAEGVGIVVGGMMGLLAFVLALTLSFANTRFTERRADALLEANAIGTAWLRAKAIGNPRGDEIARLLEDYIKVRADFVAAGRDDPAISALNQQTNALQSQIWGHLAVIVREQPNPVSASLAASLNDTFDAATSTRFAFAFRLPPQIFWLLIGMTLLSMAGLGFQLGLKKRPVRLMVVLLTSMWTIIIVDILDLGSARLGYFRTSTDVYSWTAQGFRGGLSIPPPPAAPPGR